MAVGKLLIILAANPVYANTADDPRFFNYRGGDFTNQLGNVVFGMFKRLDEEEMASYRASVMHALMTAENGEQVVWYNGRANGVSVPVITYPTGSGYCRQVHIQVSKYGVTKSFSRKGCYQNAVDNWTWYN